MDTKKSTDVPSWTDPNDAPDLTQEFFERADIYDGEKLVRRGRPKSDNPKQVVKLRLPAAVVEHFRAAGPGWQTRIGQALERLVTRKAGAVGSRKVALPAISKLAVRKPAQKKRQA